MWLLETLQHRQQRRRSSSKLMMMMMIWALGRRNKEVIWRPYRLKMEDHLKIRNMLRRGCLAISVNNVEEKKSLLCIT